MSIREFILKLQALPENKKKIILWTIVVILAAIMGFFWINSAIKSFSKLAESTKSINLPTINLPNTDILQTSSAKILPEQNLGGQATPSNTK